MKRTLEIDTWNRKAHFLFFKQFEEPFFGICTEVDCTRAYERAKAGGASFFLHYLHLTLMAANRRDAFKYRINADQVVVYDQVNASPTINRPDGTFGFSYMEYFPDFQEFAGKAQAEITRVQQTTGLELASASANIIHFSSIPWIRFTGLSHPRSFSFNDSIPKISFGKMTEENGRRNMPVSIHLHHALADGYDAGRFLELFQQLLDGGEVA